MSLKLNQYGGTPARDKSDTPFLKVFDRNFTILGFLRYKEKRY